MQRALQSWGHRSDIFAERIHPSLSKTVIPFGQYRPRPSGLALFHYSLGSQLSDFLLNDQTPLLLRYHNVTPPHLLVGANPWLKAGAAKGRQDLPRFAKRSLLALADSAFNAQDLMAAGFKHPVVLPLIQPNDLFEAQPDGAILKRFGDGRANLLFVGRIAPNKRQEDLLQALILYRQIDPGARLLLVGSDSGASGYGRWLHKVISQYGLQDAVHLSGHVTDAELAAYYRVASVFVCLSEHEGFCNPLVESMRFGLPIIAYASTAVPGTLGKAGILLKEKNFSVLAELIHLVVQDDNLRKLLIAGQTRRAADFNQAKLLGELQGHLTAVLAKIR